MNAHPHATGESDWCETINLVCLAIVEWHTFLCTGNIGFCSVCVIQWCWPVRSSLSLSAYTSATLPDATLLHFRMSRSNALPAGWTIACLPASTNHLATFVLCKLQIFLCKLQIFPPLCSAHVTFMLTVTPDCAWTLCVDQSQINQQQCCLLNGIVAKLCSVDEVVELLSALDASTVSGTQKQISCSQSLGKMESSGISPVSHWVFPVRLRVLHLLIFTHVRVPELLPIWFGIVIVKWFFQSRGLITVLSLHALASRDSHRAKPDR